MRFEHAFLCFSSQFHMVTETNHQVADRSPHTTKFFSFPYSSHCLQLLLIEEALSKFFLMKYLISNYNWLKYYQSNKHLVYQVQC